MKRGEILLYLLGVVVVGAACEIRSQYAISNSLYKFKSIGEIRRSIPVDANTRRISLENNIGEIVITPSEAGHLEIVATVKVAEELVEKAQSASFERDITTKTEGSSLRVRNAHMDTSENNQWHIDWEVKVPAGLHVSVENGVGKVELENLAGEQSIQLGVGDVEVRSKALTGKQFVRVGTGKIRFESDSIAGTVQLESGVGDVRFELEKNAAEKIDLKTGTGKIRVAVPASFDGDVDIATGVGKISSSGTDSLKPVKTPPSASLRGSLGAGKSTIQAKTGVGDIDFSRG